MLAASTSRSPPVGINKHSSGAIRLIATGGDGGGTTGTSESSPKAQKAFKLKNQRKNERHHVKMLIQAPRTKLFPDEEKFGTPSEKGSDKPR